MSTDLESEHEQLLQFIYASPIGLVEIANNGTIRMINPHAMQLLLPIAGSPVVTNFFAIMETCAPELRNKADAFPAHQGIVCLNHRVLVRTGLREDGSEPQVLACTIVKIHSQGLMVTLADITEQTSNEDRMSRARDDAEAANRAKSEFLANMSHEIRTPLNGVIGITDVALDSQPGKQQREYLETIKFSAISLLAVINDILDFSKIEAGKMDLELVEFNLTDCLEEALRCLAASAFDHRIELLCDIDADVPEMVRGDPVRLRQVVTNLVGNAIKFTAVGEVCLQAEIGESGSAGLVHFTVTDTGIGIPIEKQKAIFDAFVQADTSTTRVYGGTGLGLSICGRLVSMMGGKIWVDSEVDHGSQFHFIVPLEFLASKADPSIAVDRESLRGVKVLIVEDNSTNRRILEKMLTDQGLRVHAVEGGEQALVELHSSSAVGDPYQLMLTNSIMPNMDDCQLRENVPDHLGTSSIIMLHSAGAGERKRCNEMGNAWYLVKPIRKLELLATIVKVVNGRLINTQPTLYVELVQAPSAFHILLAEDNRINQVVAVRTLEKMGHSVVIANNGCEAIALLAESMFDLVLMDIQMPQMDGLTATKKIREGEMHGNVHIPIIALTAHAMEGDRTRCLESGMDGYVSKPINRSDLEKAINRLVKVEAEANTRI